MRRHLVPVLLALAACSKDPEPTPSADAGTTPVVTNHVEDWRDEIIYQVVTDRFANGDAANDQGVDLTSPFRYHGGDFAGIEQQIPYLQALGVTTLWISPVVKNVDEFHGGAGYHGYWAQDLSAVNPHFGDEASLRHMVDTLHAANIKVILDIVTNHFGQVFFYDINANGQADEAVQVNGQTVNEWTPPFDSGGVKNLSGGPAAIVFANVPEANRLAPAPAEFANPAWFHGRGTLKDYGNPDQVENGDFSGGLKDLKTASPDVRDALYRVYAHWMDVGDFDGFRIDTVKHVEANFWNEFCHRIRVHAAQLGKKNFLQIGEDLEGDPAKAGPYTKDEALDTLFNYPQKFVVDEVFRGKGPTSRLQEIWSGVQTNFSTRASDATGLTASQSAVNFLDNHDMARWLSGGTSKAALKSALAYVLLEDGIPALYYGTEQEFTGDQDPANREDLWKSKYAQSSETFGWIAKLTRVRKAYPALRRGRMVFRFTTAHTGTESDAGLVLFERSEGAQTVLVGINVGDAHASSATFGSGFDDGTVLQDALGGSPVTVGAQRSVTLTIPPRGVVVLVPKAQFVEGL